MLNLLSTPSVESTFLKHTQPHQSNFAVILLAWTLRKTSRTTWIQKQRVMNVESKTQAVTYYIIVPLSLCIKVQPKMKIQ